MDITKEDVERFMKELHSKRASFSAPVVKAICKIHNTEEVQDIVAHGAGIAVFEYSCGCCSRHENGKPDVWGDKDGNVYEF